MRRTFLQKILLSLGLMLFAACLVISSVIATVLFTQDLPFAETAVRTGAVLSSLSGCLALAILFFTVYTASRLKKGDTE